MTWAAILIGAVDRRSSSYLVVVAVERLVIPWHAVDAWRAATVAESERRAENQPRSGRGRMSTAPSCAGALALVADEPASQRRRVSRTARQPSAPAGGGSPALLGRHGRRPVPARRTSGDGPAAAAVGAAGPVRRLLRGRASRATTRHEGLDGQRSSPAARRRPADRRLGSGRPRVHDRLGAQGARGARRASRTWSTSPRSSSAPARCRSSLEGRLEHHHARPTSRARRSASGTSATSTRSRPRATKAGLDAGHRLHEGHPGLRHEPLAARTARSTSPRR